MAFMEPEAMSFQPSGDFKVRSFAKTGPSDEVNARYAALADWNNYARPTRVAQDKPTKPTSLPSYSADQMRGTSTSFSNPFADDKPFGLDSIGASRPSFFSLTDFGFSQGTERVPGHGSGHVDTVPAMLAPGEAVLNRAAAENFGRGNIAQLNAAGARQMGLGMHGSDEMRHYNVGTSDVGMRSTDMRDLLPPVQGQEMRDPGYSRKPSGLPPLAGQELRPGPQPAYPRSRPMNLAPPLGQSIYDPSYSPRASGLPPLDGQELRPAGAGYTQPPPRPMDNLPPIAGQTMRDPNYMPLGVPPRNAPIPQVGMPEDPFNTAWGARPDPVAQAPAPSSGWANPGAINYGGVQQPPAPNMQRLAYEPPPASMMGGYAAAGGAGPVGWAAPGGGRNGSVDPSLMQQGMGMLRPSPAAPAPSLGGERARGGSFGEAFKAARQQAGGPGGTFQWEGKPGVTFSTRQRGER